MIQSMTGFGKSVLQLPDKKITIELKSLNSKNLDINARIPSQYREKELEMRNSIAKTLQRGKVDFGLYIEVTGEETTTVINEVIISKYIQQLRNITPGEDIDFLQMAVKLPDAIRTERPELDESEYGLIKNNLDTAIAALVDFRRSEGLALEKDLRHRLQNIHDQLRDVIALNPERVEAVKQRIFKNIAELKEEVDQNRFEQELIYYIEKLDISEEMVRLEKHLSYFSENLSSEDSNGKKLGFIAQEMGREINTIGSKSNYAPMQQLVTQMKDDLEKIKEQLLNVL